MKYLLSKKQIDKFVGAYLDGKFKDGELKKSESGYYGLFHGENEDSFIMKSFFSDAWLYDTDLFLTLENLIGISKEDFESSLKRYLVNKHKIKIDRFI